MKLNLNGFRLGFNDHIYHEVNILRRKSLVSTDTVCNNFARQS